METKSVRTIPRWAYILFIVLAIFLFWRVLAGKKTSGAAPPPARPVLVAKVTTKGVPVYLDEIGTCAAYETVQVQAQVDRKSVV